MSTKATLRTAPPPPHRVTPTERGELYIAALHELAESTGDPAMQTYAETELHRITRTTQTMTTQELHHYLDGIHHALTELLDHLLHTPPARTRP